MFLRPANLILRAVSHVLFASVLSVVGVSLLAQTASDSTDDGLTKLPAYTVTERSDSQIGIADTASQGNIGQAQLKLRPIVRPGEVLETVPGLIVSQHSGEGKANQYYLRGFNLDHGTDFLTQVEGVPVNLVSHAHGQGWTDTGFLIPELVHTLEYQKGVYYAENGDLATTGAANIHYFDKLPNSIASFETGSFNFTRGLVAGSPQLGEGHLLYAFEAVYNDGPFDRGDHYRKSNGVLRYSRGGPDNGWSLTFMGYKAKWNSSDQIPLRAVSSSAIDRFGLIDPTDGGDSQRYSLTAQWHHTTGNSKTTVMVYGFYYDLHLFSNFTYFLDNPERGDQFAQPDKRLVLGLKASHTLFHRLAGANSETTVGLQVRNDTINNELNRTRARETYETVRTDHVTETSLSPYFENRTRWNSWFRTIVGGRLDEFRFHDRSNQPLNSGTRESNITSPKGSFVFGPWRDTEMYVSVGLGFHSNDARGVNTRVDPQTRLATSSDGTAIIPAKPLVRTKGGEIGVRTIWVKGLQTTVALWALDLDSELVFSGDAGTTTPSRPSRRNGVEISNYYSPLPWLTMDADFSFSKSHFRENDPIGNYIPGSVESVIAAGASIHDLDGWFGSVRFRYFGPRPLIEDNSARSKATELVSVSVGRQWGKHWSAQVEIFNVLDHRDSAIDYYYTSRLQGEPPGGVTDVHFHPIEPRSLRVSLSRAF